MSVRSNFLMIVAFNAVACSSPGPEVSGAAELSVDKELISVGPESAVVQVKVTADAEWGVSVSDKDWVSVSPLGGLAGESVVDVSVKANPSQDKGRHTEIVFRTASSNLRLPVEQALNVVEAKVDDPSLLAFLVKNHDDNDDGVFSMKEAAAIKELMVPGSGIKTLPRLSDLFPELTKLDCSSNAIKDIDLSGLSALEYLDCSDNEIGSLDLSHQSLLKYLDCSDNDLEELDITHLTGLVYLDATGNERLAEIHVWMDFSPKEDFSKPDGAQYVEPSIPTPQGYKLVWQEEFSASENGLPDSDKWWYETAEPGWVNNELQTYIAGRKGDIVTADVSDGTLKIRAIKDGNRVYSARVNTNEGWTYGYFEARLKLPKGKGTWPAFWMMPSTWSGWQDGGEIDIMEHVGCVPTEVSSSIHCKAYYHAIGTQKTAARKIATVMDEFHVYALEWTEEYIKTYVDGEQLFYYNPDNYSKGRNADTWPFNKPFQLKLNLAWGGDWGGMYGVDESCLPATYEIDYVRVFQKP